MTSWPTQSASWRRLGRRLPLGLVTAGLVGAAVSALASFGVLDGVESGTFDARVRALADPEAADSSIVIVAIDDNSIEAFRRQLGRWPWPRETHAQLLAYVTAAGARLTIFDVAFPEPDLLRASGDTAFAREIERSGSVALPMSVQPGSSEEAERWERDLGLEGRRTLLERFAVGEAEAARGMEDFAFAEPPEPMFLAPAATIGTILLHADEDGVTRRSAPAYLSRGKIYPDLALAAARLLRPERYGSPVESLTDAELRLGNGTRLPLADGGLVVGWHGRYLDGGRSTYPIYRAADVLLSYNQVAGGARTSETADVPFAALRGRVVLIATTAVGTFEPRATPLASSDPGVLIHAATLDNYLNDGFMRRASAALNVAATVGPALLVGAAVIGVNAASLGVLITLLVAGAQVLFTGWVFSRGVWLDLAAPLAGTTLSFAALMSAHYFTEGRERRRIKELFSRYVSPQHVSRLTDEYHALKLGGERVPLTVLFSDIRDFTAMSERLPPETVIATMNEYLERMVPVVFRYGGTLDKFVGDAVMAFWGAPIHVEDHARRALDAALDMMEELADLNRLWAEQGLTTRLDIGIGVNTGEAIVGNIGSLTHKVEYTVIGDTVNVANRLESLNRVHGTHIVVSESARLAAGEGFAFRPLEDSRVKGKEHALKVHELIGRTNGHPGDTKAGHAAARATTTALLALGVLVAATSPVQAQDGRKERWVDYVYQPGRWEGSRLVTVATTNPLTDSLALVARVDTYAEAPRWRAEVQRMTPGDSTASLTVLVGNDSEVVVLTPLGSTPFAQHEASRDDLVLSVVSRFESGRALRPQDGLFVDRMADQRVLRVVRRVPAARGEFGDELLQTGTGRIGGLAALGIQSLAPGRSQAVVASAGPRGVARVRTVDGEIVVTPDTEAVNRMQQWAASYLDLDRFLRELALGIYAPPARREERR
jgi:adenylate cyclase